MKKLVLFALVLALLLPEAACASSGLGMTLGKFIAAYNNIEAPIGAPYAPLEKPFLWSEFNEYKIACFYPTMTTDIMLILMTKGTASLDSGLDAVQLYTQKTEQMFGLISVTARCVDIFTDNLFGNSLSSIPVTNVIRYFYESNAEKKGMNSYVTIDSEQKYALTLIRDSSWYTFQISTVEAVQ